MITIFSRGDGMAERPFLYLVCYLSRYKRVIFAFGRGTEALDTISVRKPGHLAWRIYGPLKSGGGIVSISVAGDEHEDICVDHSQDSSIDNATTASLTWIY